MPSYSGLLFNNTTDWTELTHVLPYNIHIIRITYVHNTYVRQIMQWFYHIENESLNIKRTSSFKDLLIRKRHGPGFDPLQLSRVCPWPRGVWNPLSEPRLLKSSLLSMHLAVKLSSSLLYGTLQSYPSRSKSTNLHLPCFVGKSKENVKK